MKFKNFALARRYAQAFLNVFYPLPQTAPLAAYEKLLRFFHEQPGVIGLIVNCPCPQSCFNQLEEFLIKKFGLTAIEKKLFHRLLLDRKINLFAAVIEHLVDLEHKRRDELVCTIEFSHPPSHEVTQQAIDAFSSMTQLKVLPKIVIKPSLICGVRMYSKTLSYERSIAKDLNDAQTLTKTKGGLW